LNATESPALSRYTKISTEEKYLDFFLHDLSDHYWESEYQLDGVPVPFKSDFIIHLQSIEQGVRIEVISYLPRVRLGKKFRITGHHGPDVYDDIRRVAPTTQDRKEVLKLIVDLITGSQ